MTNRFCGRAARIFNDKSQYSALRDAGLNIIHVSQCQWRVSGKGGAAELLDLKPTTLYAKIRKLKIRKNLTYE